MVLLLCPNMWHSSREIKTWCWWCLIDIGRNGDEGGQDLFKWLISVLSLYKNPLSPTYLYPKVLLGGIKISCQTVDHIWVTSIPGIVSVISNYQWHMYTPRNWNHNISKYNFIFLNLQGFFSGESLIFLDTVNGTLLEFKQGITNINISN